MQSLLDVSLSGVLDAVVKECDGCGFRQVRPRLQRHELSILYPSDYFDANSPLGFSDYHRQQMRAEREAYFLAKRLKRIAPTGRLLEVGCALGFLLHGLEQYCRWQVTGIDVSHFAIYFARRSFGLDAQHGTLEESAFEDNAFDFIVQKDLLEHVPKPRAHLEETVRVLKSGGYLWIVTPNGDADIRSMQKIARKFRAHGEERLPCLDQGHVSFFRMEHLLRLFDEQGLECIRVRNLDVQRGLRLLGILPMKKKSFVTAPRGNRREERVSDNPDAFENRMADENPEYEAVYEQIRAAMEHARKPFRSSPAYFHFRHLSNTMNSLPAPFRYGSDFDFLLRKR
jgi:2-polyprenyl-3-methyl-5-hydroxy-6-metoxy-1,4-benzoquinol methylase